MARARSERETGARDRQAALSNQPASVTFLLCLGLFKYKLVAYVFQGVTLLQSTLFCSSRRCSTVLHIEQNLLTGMAGASLYTVRRKTEVVRFSQELSLDQAQYHMR